MCVCNISLYGFSPFHHKALVSANTFKFWNLFSLSCLAQKSGMNTIRSRGFFFLFFFMLSWDYAQILILNNIPPSKPNGKPPSQAHSVEAAWKNVDSTSRRWFNVWWMLDQLCLPNWQALSVPKPRLLCWILNSLTSRQKLFYRSDKSCSNCWKTKT